MTAAMKAVSDKETTITQAAAKKYSVLCKTLDDRIKKKVEHGSRPGPSTVLTKEEEDGLVSYLVYMAQRGFPRNFTKAFAWAIAVRSGKADRFGKEGPSENWWTGFRHHHLELTLRKVDKLEQSRVESLNPNSTLSC